MRTAAMKSFLAKPDEVGGEWHVVDAEGKVLGRFASRIATILMGKHRPTYTPHVLTGDFVVVTNARKIKLTGRKLQQEAHEHYTYHPGGRKVEPIAEVLEKHPDRVIVEAVKRMLPKNKLAYRMLKRLKVYPGAEHPHQAQQPKPLDIRTA